MVSGKRSTSLPQTPQSSGGKGLANGGGAGAGAVGGAERASSCESVPDSALESDNKINCQSAFIIKILQALPCYMSEPLDLLELPRLDPLAIEYQDLNFNIENTLRLSGWVKNLEATSLSTMRTTAGTDFQIDVKIPNVELSTAYEIDARLMDEFSIWGTGDLSVKITDIALSFTIQTPSPLNFTILNFSCNLDIGSLTVNITGLYNDPEISQAIGETIGELFPEIYSMYKDKVINLINVNVPPIMNEMLGGKTTQEMLTIYSTLTNSDQAKPCLDSYNKTNMMPNDELIS